MGLHSELSFADSLKSEERTGFYERHKPIAVAMRKKNGTGYFVWACLGQSPAGQVPRGVPGSGLNPYGASAVQPGSRVILADKDGVLVQVSKMV